VSAQLLLTTVILAGLVEPIKLWLARVGLSPTARKRLTTAIAAALVLLAALIPGWLPGADLEARLLAALAAGKLSALASGAVMPARPRP